MYARVNTIFAARGQASAGVSYLEDSDRRVVESAAGNRGLTTLVAPDAGVVVAMSYWDDLRSSSEAELTEARAGAASAAGGALVTETFEVAAVERPADPDPGATVHMTRVQLDSTRADAGLAFIRDELLQRLSASAGLRSAELLIDREIGSGLLVMTWTDHEAANQANSILDDLRGDAEVGAGATFARSESYVLVRQSARSH